MNVPMISADFKKVDDFIISLGMLLVFSIKYLLFKPLSTIPGVTKMSLFFTIIRRDCCD